MAEKSAATAPVLVKKTAPESQIERFNQVYNEIANRAFNIFSRDGRFGRDLDNWLKAEVELLHPVPVKVTESDGNINVEAEVPGFEAKDLEVTLEPQRLIISGKRETKEESKKGKTVYSEQRSDEILRVVRLPEEVDATKATATVKNGVLEVVAPKSAKARSSSVEVKAA